MELEDDCCRDADIVDVVVDRPNKDRYDWEERAGRLRALAALCSKGQVVDEKL